MTEANWGFEAVFFVKLSKTRFRARFTNQGKTAREHNFQKHQWNWKFLQVIY